MTPFPLRENDIPRLHLTRPPNTNPTTPLDTLLICPGGGYRVLAPHEAQPVAEWAHSLGLAAAILSYRVAPEATHPNPLTDALDAITLLRNKKSELHLTGKIAVLGFSAGGHLAASLSTHGAHNPLTRPDASLLIYPVITMDHPNLHTGSRANLLGENPSPELITKVSNEKQVTPNTPPAFLVHGIDDAVVPVENVLLYATALRHHNIPFELHIYPKGIHGFGMGNPTEHGPIAHWPQLAGTWLKETLRTA